MKVGDIVYHRKTGQRLSVKQTARGDGFVLCCWMGTDSIGKPMELSSAFDWKELTTVKPSKVVLTGGTMHEIKSVQAEMPSDEQRSMDELTKSMNELAQQTESALATPEPQQHKRRRQ